LCGVAAILGHVYPIYHGFRGGKGAGTAIGMIAAIMPVLLPFVIGIWLLVLILTGYVGLATICTGISVPVFTAILKTDNSFFLQTGIIMSIFIILTHRSNIKRMLTGNENRFDKIRIFK